MSINSEFTFIDLFCGAGGLSLGFQRSGFRCACAIDSDRAAVETYKLNFQDHILRDKITEKTRLVSADVIIGGPPCQGFSSAGMRCSDDKRNSLVRVFSELVARNKPKAFVFENVEGFLTADKGERILDLLTPLVQVGYRIHLRKVNAANFGVPQHRKRVIAIGALGWDPTYPEATHMAFGAPGAAKVFRHLPRCPTVEDVLMGLPQPTLDPPGMPQGHYVRRLSELDVKRIELLKPGQSMKDLPEEL
ncbi:MAG: DNA cytosine methyltransferase, partial [Chloroflexota bacterium]|nr:DNA cytosine methyltransferase [Chloroflexota bacterium]